jgi:hypothetical protein
VSHLDIFRGITIQQCSTGVAEISPHLPEIPAILNSGLTIAVCGWEPQKWLDVSSAADFAVA